MKTVDLIACLKPEEVQDLRLVLDKHRRRSLSRLFHELLQAAQKSNEPENIALFPVVFQQPYRKELDYLLRNELRLLNREIETFLLEREVLRKIRQNETEEIIPALVWLQLLLDRQQFDLFEKEWRRIEKLALERQAFALLQRLYEVYLSFIYRYQELHLALYQKAFTQLENARHFGLLAAEEQCRLIDVKLAYVHRILRAFDASYANPFVETVVQSSPHAKDYLLFRYLRLWAETYVAENKIPLYTQLLEWQPDITKTRPELSNNEFVFLNNLALLWMHEKKDYKKADFYFTHAMDHYFRSHKKINNELFFNYLSNLTRLNRFPEVIQLYEVNRGAVESDQKLKYKFCYLLSMNYLLMGNTSLALVHIPEDLRQRPRFEYIYTRFIYAIAYFLDGMEEVFEREIQNLYQTIRYKTPEEAKEWAYTLNIFRKFGRIFVQEPDPAEKKKQYIALMEEMEKEEPDKTANADNLIIFWLLKTLRSIAVVEKR